MSEVIPNTIEVEVLTTMVTPALTIRLYGNNATPSQTSTAGSFTEISGGGYLAQVLTFANWTITSGDPSAAQYNTVSEWDFTGVINAPGTIYGYFVTRNSDGKLMWAERFPTALVPFIPIGGSVIRVLAKVTAQSQF